MGKVSDSQKRANKKWDDNNKERKQYLNKRSVAKNFILKNATIKDLDQLEKYIAERKSKLNC
ncbi:MAG: hypothetical protein HDR41_04120 [Lactobacillus sp.]|nr:hypothetical protein [Lactobacillus sp.]